MRLHADALAVLLLAIAFPAWAQDIRRGEGPAGDAGPQLTVVLQALQAGGLRIVFTSSLVTPDMRVRAAPRAATPRRQLDEILAPHGLMAVEGPGGVLQIVRTPRNSELRSAPFPPLEKREASTIPAPFPRYNERIDVTSARPWSQPATSIATETVNHRELEAMPAGLVDDPVRAIHSMPRVAPLGDYRSEFIVRASPFRHAEVVVDGVSTAWLRHGPVASASVSMLTTQLVDSATLRAGAHARTYGDHLGPQLELTLREGSRDHVRVQGTVSNTAATVVAEGPIGRARGSWIAAARQSLLEWPGEHVRSTIPVFGFSDAMGKLVFDISGRHQLGFTMLSGRSRVDGEEDAALEPLDEATARASVANLSWRSMIGSSTVLTQRAYLIRQEAVSEPGTPSALTVGSDQEAVYRAALVSKTSLGVVRSGAQLGRTTFGGPSPETASTRSGYLHLEAQPADRLTLSPGIRVSGASHVAGPAVSPWLLGELGIGRWTISASTGLSHQFPKPGPAIGLAAGGRLQPERAIHVDVGIRQQVTANVRWEVTLYQRRERGVLLVDRDDSRFSGSARGFEMVLDRRSTNGLSGWGAYTYGRARHADAAGGETFWADFDQRHGMTAFGMYRWPDSTSLGATLRVGSGVPIPGYLSAPGENLFVGERRNDVRLSTYARFDVRAERAFRLGGRSLQAFVEVINVFNRSNTGAAAGTFKAGGETAGFVERLAPRRASAGVTIAF